MIVAKEAGIKLKIKKIINADRVIEIQDGKIELS